MSLTGRSRYRLEPRFLRPALVVLEVEERVPVNWDHRDGHQPRHWTTRWRDANPSDLEVHQTVRADPDSTFKPPPPPPIRPQR